MNDSKQLITRYNTLLKKQKDSETRLVELRTQYNVAKDELDALTQQLKQDFNVNSIDEAKDLLEQYRLDIEMELDSLEENVNQLDGI
jgi:uncharacterized protein YnzC (UPF0291/DUF896 family)